MADHWRKPTAIFISTPTGRVSWFEQLWHQSRGEPQPEQFRFAAALKRVDEELIAYVERTRKQQVHIDEIKRLCHVKPE